MYAGGTVRGLRTFHRPTSQRPRPGDSLAPQFRRSPLGERSGSGRSPHRSCVGVLHPQTNTSACPESDGSHDRANPTVLHYFPWYYFLRACMHMHVSVGLADPAGQSSRAICLRTGKVSRYLKPSNRPSWNSNHAEIIEPTSEANQVTNIGNYQQQQRRSNEHWHAVCVLRAGIN